MQPAAVGGCRLHEQIAAGRGSGLSCRGADRPGTRSKCFDLCFCASTAVKTQMQQMQRVVVVAAAVVAVAVGVSLLAFSFKMFNYARLSSRRLPSPPLPHAPSTQRSVQRSDHLLLFYSFNLSVLHQANKSNCSSNSDSNSKSNSASPSPSPSFPGQSQKVIAPHLQHFYSLIIVPR